MTLNTEFKTNLKKGEAGLNVFIAYQCLTFHHRILPCQVWARGSKVMIY